MSSNLTIDLDSRFIVCLIITLLGAIFAVFLIILRKKRIKSGNVVCSKSKFWVYNIFLLVNPLLITFLEINISYHNPILYAVFSVFIIIYMTSCWINSNITFYNDGFITTNPFFVKKFYPYSAVAGIKVERKKITRHDRYHRRSTYSFFDEYYKYYALIFVKMEDTPTQIKVYSIDVDSYNYVEFMRMIDMNCPQLHQTKRPPAGNGNPGNFYGDNNY